MKISIKNEIEKKEQIVAFLKENNISFTMENESLIVGDLAFSSISSLLKNMEIVPSLPIKLSSLINHPSMSVIKIKNVSIGGNNPFFIAAGPCAVEDEKQMQLIASSIKESGATGLRGGAYKPRTSPYSFQGIGEKGLKFLGEAAKKNNLISISEITSISELKFFEKYVDIIQVGARNMQNFELLKSLGKTKKTILLKRGFANTIEELLFSAEYIMANGNPNVILCERGIRTFEKLTRNTLDLTAVAVLKRLTHLPVIVDPSHATGNNLLVQDMLASIVCSGADGLMVEVHNNPGQSVSDGPESLNLVQFDQSIKQIKGLSLYIKRGI